VQCDPRQRAADRGIRGCRCADRGNAGVDASSGAIHMIEFIRYFAASGLAFGVDLGLYRLGLSGGFGYAASACVGFTMGLAVAYGLSVRWAFRVRGLRDARAEFVIFALVGLVGLALTEALLWLQVGLLHVAPVVAKVFAAAIVFLFNFGARKVLLFTRRGPMVARHIA
jgi:putative flippase GtrA